MLKISSRLSQKINIVLDSVSSGTLTLLIGIELVAQFIEDQQSVLFLFDYLIQIILRGSQLTLSPVSLISIFLVFDSFVFAHLLIGWIPRILLISIKF